MPFTVITLKKVPDSLRGDLTRWMQEIATGVYVGSFNSRVREYLWKRVLDTIGKGEATICYSCRNEIGYSFNTCNTERQMLDFDGIPLVLIPEKKSFNEISAEKQHGFSNASKYHQTRRKVKGQATSAMQLVTSDEALTNSTASNEHTISELVFLDIETTGLNVDTDQIIEIGAIKVSNDEEITFHRLIRATIHIPAEVRRLTGITDEMLRDGTKLEASIRDLHAFIQGASLVGYNISFDIKFLNKVFEEYSMEPIRNKTLELMYEAKRRNSFQTNYKFETTLKEYGINRMVLHRALEDAKLMHQLYIRMGLE